MEEDFSVFRVNVMSSGESRGKFIAQVSDFMVKNIWEIEWQKYAQKYDMNNLDLFFDGQHGRFRMLNELIKNFEGELQDFKYIEPRIDDVLNELKDLREDCNVVTHSLGKETRLKEDDLDDIRDKVNFLISMMIRIYNNIS
jgi:uncharacterized protein (UPF0248 family)